jgi:cysteinyl-tRNA synthetase
MRLESYVGRESPDRPDVAHFIQEARHTFKKALGNDLNVPEATAAMFEMLRHVNGFCDQMRLTTEDAMQLLHLLKEMDSVLGVCTFTHEAIPTEIQQLVDQRQEARKSRDFARSDAIRHELLQKGYVLEDTPQGIRVKKV